jgi:hypothetical protein
MPGVKKSNQKKGDPSSAPYAHPCAPGSRESVGAFGQAIPGLSKTLAASLRPTLRVDRPPPAAPQAPVQERGLLPASALLRHNSGWSLGRESLVVMHPRLAKCIDERKIRLSDPTRAMEASQQLVDSVRGISSRELLFRRQSNSAYWIRSKFASRDDMKWLVLPTRRCWHGIAEPGTA